MKGHEKHILSPQSINFAPSVNLGRRTSHSPARSLFHDILLMSNQKEYNKKFADYYNLRNPTSLMYKISILYKYDHFSDHLWDNYRIDCGALSLQIWMHIAIQCNIYIGMSKNLTYTLSVSPTADTVCGKGVA